MGLRESLQDLLTLQDISGGFAQAGQRFGAQREAMQNASQLRDVAQKLPGALESGDLTGVAAQAYGAGDPLLLQNVLAGNLASQKAANSPGKTPGLQGDALRAALPGMAEDFYMVAQNIPTLEEQRQLAQTGSSITGAQAQRGLLRLGEERREQSEQMKAQKDFTTKVDNALKKERDDLQQLERVANMDLSDRTQFWLAATNMIKTIGREAGQLTDNDVGRPFPVTGARTVKDLLTWLGAQKANINNIDPEVLESVQDVLRRATAKVDEQLQTKGIRVIRAEAIAGRDRLLKDKNVDESIINAAKTIGLTAGFNDKGEFDVGKEIKKSSGKLSMESRGQGDEFQSLYEKLNPQQKLAADRKLKEFKDQGKPIPPGFVQRLKQLVGEQ